MKRLVFQIACFVLRLAPVGLPLPVLRGPLRGRWWIAGAAAGPGRGLSVLFNASEPRQAALADDLAKPGTVCFDIGANVGFYSLIFARRAKAVYSFEPLPRNLRFLIRLTQLNRLGNVRTVPGAVGAGSGVAFFAEGRNPAEGAVSEEGDQPVLTTSVDAFVAETDAAPDLVKIDVEGAEAEVLRGGFDTFRNRRPAILLSIHSDALRRECLALLGDCGYERIEPLDATDPAQATEYAAFAE